MEAPSDLVMFRNYLRNLVGGFEGGILDFLGKTQGRIVGRDEESIAEKKQRLSTGLERELKILECTVNNSKVDSGLSASAVGKGLFVDIHEVENFIMGCEGCEWCKEEKSDKISY